jgi:hypothetical protein
VRAAFVFLDEDSVMHGFRPVVALKAFACALSPLVAVAADDVAALRAELQALRADYDARVAALESRLTQLEAAPSPALPPEPAPAARAGASAFNPAISLILGGAIADTSRDPGDWRVAGFLPNGGEIGPGERSFSLGESEITLSASVDPYFSGTLIAAVTGEDEIEVEEAYFRTLAMPAGLSLKGGRFFSGIGYLNEVHAHAWDFADQPLAYQAFYANQYAQDGLQLKWLAPTDLFVEIGAEAGRDGAFPGTGRDRNGLGGTALFAHLGGDIGDSASWRIGASWNESDAEDRAYEDADQTGSAVLNAFTGRSRTWIADAVFKWTPRGGVPGRQLKLQGEYLSRRERGTLAFDLDGAALADAYRSSQSGWYLQGVYQFLSRWRAGVRYDALDSGTPAIGLVSGGALPPEAFPALLPGDATRSTVMLDWNPSEFSRWRLQYAWDEARDDGDTDRQLRLQYLFGIGAHGAHKY